MQATSSACGRSRLSGEVYAEAGQASSREMERHWWGVATPADVVSTALRQRRAWRAKEETEVDGVRVWQQHGTGVSAVEADGTEPVVGDWQGRGSGSRRTVRSNRGQVSPVAPPE